MNIQFVKPDINENEIEAVSAALRSGWITTGPVTKQFEKDIAEYINVPKAVCINSQTAGAEMILRLLGVGPGDEVIVPAYTYSASCSIVYHVGATPVMVDSQLHSPEMDYEKLEDAITERTKVIIPVDLAGIISDYGKVFKAVENKKDLFKANPDNCYQKLFNRVIVVADTAHSFGAEMNGIKAGNFADFSSFSFHAVKNLTTAEGGAITWKDQLGLDHEEIYKTFMLLTLHGQNKDALAKTKASAWEYDIIEPWYKCNMTDIAAAIGASQLKRYPEMLARRSEIISKFDSAFKELPVEVLDHHRDNQVSSGHLYFLKINNFEEDDRNRFIEQMGGKGISCNVHYKPLPMLSAYSKRGFDIKNYPNAYSYYKNLVSLPLYSTLTDAEVDYIISAVRELLGQ